LIAVKLPIRADGSVDEAVSRESVAEHLGRVVEGESVEIGVEGKELGSAAEVHRVKKVYKIACAKGKGGGKKGGSGEEKDDRKDLESVILGTIALKGA
jgi:EKC/KEOPS complex subunit CGI121/TPRKB